MGLRRLNRANDAPIRVVMMPKDTNALGSIFGGVILSYLDLAAGEHARRVSPEHLFVTKILREVDFIAPVRVGDTVSYYTETVSIGRTSITVRVRVEAERGVGRRTVLLVTEAEVVMVAVDRDGHPTPIASSAKSSEKSQRPATSRKGTRASKKNVDASISKSSGLKGTRSQKRANKAVKRRK